MKLLDKVLLIPEVDRKAIPEAVREAIPEAVRKRAREAVRQRAGTLRTFPAAARAQAREFVGARQFASSFGAVRQQFWSC